MCTKECGREVKRYIKCIMYFCTRHFILFLRRIFKVTLCELLWICTVFIFIFFMWTWIISDSDIRNRTSENPVILWWPSGFPGISQTRYCSDNVKCDVYSNVIETKSLDVEAYLFYASTIDFSNLPLPRTPEVIWGLYHEESPRNVEVLLHEIALKIFNYSSTFSRNSDVPFPLQYLESIEEITNTKYYVPTSLKNSLSDLAPLLYLQSDCETSTERDMYVAELMKFINIDSYGACLNNKELSMELKEDYLNKLNDDNFLEFIARYKFIIAIENGVCNDYVTEKFWRAIKVGSVPIYFGSPSIRDWLPNNKSAILLVDYPTPEIMASYIKTLLNNDSLYEAHLEHKTKNLIRNKRLINELKVRPYQTDTLKVVKKFECFICQKIHDKKLGKLKENVINKDHYNCPTPISALTLNVNPENSWVYSWMTAESKAEAIYNKVLGN